MSGEPFTYAHIGGRWDETDLARFGTLWAGFRGAGGIGLYDDETVVICSGEASAGLPMVTTARPATTEPLEPGGIFALRTFEITHASDWDEFLALSVESWPEFEELHGARIEGLFRFTQLQTDDAEALLVTRYPSLAAWEQSRTTINPSTASGRNFLRRRELTRRSVVRIAGSFWKP